MAQSSGKKVPAKRAKRDGSSDSSIQSVQDSDVEVIPVVRPAVVRSQARGQQSLVQGKTDRQHEKNRSAEADFYIENGASDRRKDKGNDGDGSQAILKEIRLEYIDIAGMNQDNYMENFKTLCKNVSKYHTYHMFFF